MMTVLILAVAFLALLVFGLKWSQRETATAPQNSFRGRPPNSSKPAFSAIGPKTSLPARVLNPANLRASGQGFVWRLAAGQAACEGARILDGRRVEANDSLPLPLSDCNQCANCTCRYMPILDGRKSARRTRSDRRDDIRFETEKKDRRTGVDRRRANKAWRPGSYN